MLIYLSVGGSRRCLVSKGQYVGEQLLERLVFIRLPEGHVAIGGHRASSLTERAIVPGGCFRSASPWQFASEALPCITEVPPDCFPGLAERLGYLVAIEPSRDAFHDLALSR